MPTTPLPTAFDPSEQLDGVETPAARAERRRQAARSRTRFRIAASAVIVLAAALVAWLLLRPGDSTPASSNAVSASPAQLQTLARSVGHPVFWLGPMVGSTTEVVRANDGSVFVRYLPRGTKTGAKGSYLTVATYPYPGAYAAIKAVVGEKGASPIPLRGGGIAEMSSKATTNVHFAFPGVDFQGEVFDPTPGKAATWLRDGKLVAIGGLTTAAAPQTASLADLKAAAARFGHPVYWLGPREGTTPELSTSSNGQTTVRYLPSGTAPGAPGEYLAVGTYPYPDAYAAIQALAKEPDAVVIRAPAGGFAVVDSDRPTNVHLAYPGGKVQIEIFSPSPSLARTLVASGALAGTD